MLESPETTCSMPDETFFSIISAVTEQVNRFKKNGSETPFLDAARIHKGLGTHLAECDYHMKAFREHLMANLVARPN